MPYNKNYFANSSVVEYEGETNDKGEKIGKWVYYYPNGNIKSSGHYDSDLAEGEWTFYSESGVIQSKGGFEKGQWHGPWQWYDEKGNLREKGSYRNNLLHGHHTWFVNGKITTEGEYREGKKAGVWKWYNNEGILVRKDEYLNDQIHGTSEIFNDDGSPKEIAHYYHNLKHGEFITFQKGKKKVQKYEMGLLLLSDDKMQKIAEQLNTQKDYYKKTDVLIKKFGYEGITPALWYFVTKGYLDINKHIDLLYELTSYNAETFFTPQNVIKILQQINLAEHKNSYTGITPYWNTHLDKMTFWAYQNNPRAFDDSFSTFTHQAQKGFCTLLARAGKAIPENLKKEILQDIATQVANFGTLGNTKIGEKQEFLYTLTEGKIDEINILNIEGTFNKSFYEFLENFGSYSDWQNTLLSAALSPKSANIHPNRCKDAFQIASVEQFCALIKKMHYSGYHTLYHLFNWRGFGIDELEHCAKILDEGWQKGYRAEIALVVAILQHQEQKKAVPKWYDEWLNLDSFYWGESNGTMFEGLDFTKKALEYLGKERSSGIILKKLGNQYGWEKSFAFINLLDKKEQDELISKLSNIQESNLYSIRNFIQAISQLHLEYLESKLKDFASNSIPYQILQTSILAHLANFAKNQIQWSESYDTYLDIHLWQPQYQDDFAHYLLPYYKKILSFLPSQRIEKILLPQIDLQKNTWGRIFSLFNENTPQSLLQKAAESLAKASASQISKIRNFVYYFLLDFRESGTASYFVKIALQNNAKGEILQTFQEGLGTYKYEEILKQSGKQASTPATKSETIKQLIDEYFAEKPDAPTTHIYYLEPLYDQKPDNHSLNYIGGQAPIKKELIPTFENKKMQHIFTLDVRTMPLLAQRIPENTIALSFFVYNPDYNEAYEPFNEQTAILFLKEGDIQRSKSLADSYTFQITALKVPTEIFDYECSDEGREIRKKVYQAPCYVLGEPIWLQDEQHQGNFLLQFDESFGNVNLGDSGLMYVFEDTAFWQCY
jgi:antitoxin component YwqK of YwqJK toxin-antitoxin module